MSKLLKLAFAWSKDIKQCPEQIYNWSVTKINVCFFVYRIQSVEFFY